MDLFLYRNVFHWSWYFTDSTVHQLNCGKVRKQCICYIHITGSLYHFDLTQNFDADIHVSSYVSKYLVLHISINVYIIALYSSFSFLWFVLFSVLCVGIPEKLPKEKQKLHYNKEKFQDIYLPQVYHLFTNILLCITCTCILEDVKVNMILYYKCRFLIENNPVKIYLNWAWSCIKNVDISINLSEHKLLL